jgi:hypothetical protein
MNETRVMSEDEVQSYGAGLVRGRAEGVAKLNELIEYFEQMRQLALRDKDCASIQDAFAFEAEARCYEHARDMVIAWKATDSPAKAE